MEASPQAADNVRRIDATMWTNPFLISKRYGHNTSNLVEIMNSQIINERRLSIIDLHARWSKCMNSRFRPLQELGLYDPTAVLIKYSSQLLQESLQHASNPIIRYADANNSSVLSFPSCWYAISLLAHTCSWDDFSIKIKHFPVRPLSLWLRHS